MRRAYSSGVASHGCTAACEAVPRNAGEGAVGENAHDRVRQRVDILDPHEQARDAVLHDVGDPTDATPDDTTAAAECLDDDAPEPLRARGEHEDGGLVECARNLRGGERLAPARLRGQVPNERLDRLAQCPAPDEVERRVGHARCGAAPGVGENVDGLVALEHADEQRDRALGKRRGWDATNGSRSMNAANSAVGSTPARRTRPDV